MKKVSREKLIRDLIPLLIIAVGLVMFMLGMRTFRSNNDSREIETLRNAINRNITACYAETGAYPETLEQLITEYNIIYDKDRYFIDYVVTGSNLRPEITIIERRSKQ